MHTLSTFVFGAIAASSSSSSAFVFSLLFPPPLLTIQKYDQLKWFCFSGGVSAANFSWAV
jgi:hypothetical protein